jgi:hypothetical protein
LICSFHLCSKFKKQIANLSNTIKNAGFGKNAETTVEGLYRRETVRFIGVDTPGVGMQEGYWQQ